MVWFSPRITRAFIGLGSALLSIGLVVSDVAAQSTSCARLTSTLRTLERNNDFRASDRNAQQARRLSADVQDAESTYVRTGCNARAKAGERLTGNCLALARQINEGRADYARLSERVDTGSAIARQRESVLQEISRFGCRSGDSTATVDGGSRRENLFDRLFGGFSGSEGDFQEGDIVDDGFGSFGGQSTVRTVCVRTCDGYFWPVSYATVPDYVGNDAQQCQAQCPGAEVNLYYYDNPGQEAEQMVDLVGQPYSALPNAFRYRREFDPGCSCKAPANTGVITIAGGGDYGQSRAVIDFEGASFPLPLRDPRRGNSVDAPMQQAAVTADQNAVFVSVPLPRRRPPAPGEEAVARPVVVPDAQSDMRVVQFGDKSVRIVGPDTPYAQSAEAGP